MSSNINLLFNSLSAYKNYSFIAGIFSKGSEIGNFNCEFSQSDIPTVNGVVAFNNAGNPNRKTFISRNENITIWSFGNYIDIINTNAGSSVNQLLSDESSVANIYEKFGDGLFSDIMFEGIALIYDRRNESITLYSEKMGLEDIYYYFDGEIFAFCNLIGPLAKAFSKRFDSIGAMNYMLTGAVLGPITLFENISSILPANKIKVAINRNIVSKLSFEIYWQLPKPLPLESLNESYLENYFADAFLKAMERRVDKEVNVFLSGGLDSSSIVSASQNNFGSKVNAFNYRLKGYSPQLVETEIIQKFQKDFNFSLNFLEVENLGGNAYNLWKEFTKYSPNYFSSSTLILTDAISSFNKQNPGSYPFLTGETADTVIDFWCGVKGNGFIPDTIANLNRYFYSPKGVILSKLPISPMTKYLKQVSNNLYRFFSNKGILSKFYKYIDLFNSIIYSFGRPEIYYTGRLVAGTPGWSSAYIQTPDAYKYTFDDNILRMANTFTKNYSGRITRENMMQVYALLLIHALSYTDTQIYRRVCNFFERTIHFPYLDTEFVSMTTAIPFKHRAFKSLFRKVGINKLKLPDYVAKTQKIDFYVKDDKPVHQLICEMPIGELIRENMKEPEFLNYIDESTVNLPVIEDEMKGYKNSTSITPNIFLYQTLEWNCKDIFQK